MTGNDIHRAIDAVWRIESARVIASLARVVRDVGPRRGARPGRAPRRGSNSGPRAACLTIQVAWLTAAAKNRAIDRIRRAKLIERKHEEIGYEIESNPGRPRGCPRSRIDDDIGDDLLRLVFTACIRCSRPKRAPR